MAELKLTSLDDVIFLPLPAEFLACYGLKVGDLLLLQEKPNGFSLTVPAAPTKNMPQHDDSG